MTSEPRAERPRKYSVFGAANEIVLFVVAMLFILFDIEVIFFFPWAVAFRQLGLFGFIQMMIFAGILLAGYIWVWKKGALEWE